MRIDTHTHLLLTKKSIPNWKEIELHFKVAKAQKLDVLCITEHIDAEFFTELYHGLFISNKLCGEIIGDGIVKLNGLLIVSGAEIPLKDGGEVGLQTNLSTILSLNKQNSFYSIDELFNTVSKMTKDYIMIGNHLYVPGKWIEHAEEKLAILDAIEILPKEIHRKHHYESLADKLKKPLLSGSDSHVWSQLGIGYNEVHFTEYTLEAFKKAMKLNEVKMILSSEAEKLSAVSTLHHEFLMHHEDINL